VNPNENVNSILDAVAVGLDAIDAATDNVKVSVAAKGAATIVRLLAAITKDRTPEEAIAILEEIRDHGAKPIAQSELDAQIDAAIAKV
jgi:hypothetical protein